MEDVKTNESGGFFFVGEFTHALDPKRRLTIPADWRERMGEENSLYVLPDIYNKNLLVYRGSEIIHKIQKFRNHSIADREAMKFARIIGSKSELVSWDSQGRIRIKDQLLEYADLTDQVVISGSFDHFELWTPDNFRSISNDGPQGLKDAARYVGF